MMAWLAGLHHVRAEPRRTIAPRNRVIIGLNDGHPQTSISA
jgi:hypothetical protein